MPSYINWNGSKPVNLKAEIVSEAEFLKNSAELERRLDLIDDMRGFQRAYVMGSGRSGTWLLAALLSTLKGADVLPYEVPFELFGMVRTNSPLLVLKRDAPAYERIERIPSRIHIVYAVRHPFDVLTSHNPTTTRKYHVLPHVYLGNILALQYLVDTQRHRTHILKYEDVVERPDEAQSRLADAFGLPAAVPAWQIDQTFKAAPAAAAAMHGVRQIDTNSIGRYRNDPSKLEYLRELRPRLGRTLEWLAEEFGYDIGLPGG